MTSGTSKILIVEDTPSIALVYEKWLTKSGYETTHVETGEAAIESLRSGIHSIVLLDLELPGISGFDVLRCIKEERLSVTVVVVTSSGSIKSAVDAMRHGAYDFIVKPAAEERIVTTVRNALERQELTSVVEEIKRPYANAQFNGFIGSSLSMVSVYRTIEAVAQSKASVFITGESGTGKEVCAEAIHKSSPRRLKPFVAINCAAIPKDLIESEIFGHVKGAFTGATSDREGAAATASGGTLFLDEICEMDIALQSKLLRFLQTGSVQKVGSDQLKAVDTRIVCATNKDPLQQVHEGNFREDLYYRLYVVPIELPPLRDRDRDVLEIAENLLARFSKEEGKSFKKFSKDAEDLLLSHQWPGNIRELQNVIRNATILHDVEILEADMLTIRPATMYRPEVGNDVFDQADGAGAVMKLNFDRCFEAVERDIIEAAIKYCDNSIPKAADMLALSPSTIYRKKEGWEKMEAKDDDLEPTAQTK